MTTESFGVETRDVLISDVEVCFSVRSKFFIPLVLVTLPLLGLLVGSFIGNLLVTPADFPPFWNLIGISDGYEAGGVLGLRFSLLCVLVIVSLRLRNDFKKNELTTR